MSRYARGSLAAVLLLAAAIGAATTLTSVFLFTIADRPPVDEPDRLVTIWEKSEFTLRGRTPLTLAQFEQWIALAAPRAMPAVFVDGRAVLHADASSFVAEQRVSENFFRLCGRAPQIGRVPTPDELRTDAAVAVIGGRVWRRIFGGDVNVLGRIVTIDRRSYEIVGVMPDDFWFIFRRTIDLWRPLPAGGNGATPATVTARLPAGERADSLEAALNAAATRLPEYFAPHARVAVVQMLSEEFTVRSGPGLVLLVGPSFLILFCACANAANLLLIRSVSREKEFAIRAALGASPGRLLRQSARETLAIVASAGALGAVLGYGGHTTFLRVLASAQGDVRRFDAQPWIVVLAALAATAIAFPAAAAVPALSAARANVAEAFRETLRAPRLGRGRYGVFDLLLVLQVGLAVVLVLMATFLFGFTREFSRLRPHFDTTAATVTDIFAADARGSHQSATALAALERSPEVAGAAFASRPPLPPERTSAVRVADDDGERECMVTVVGITPGYFGALQLAGTDGRIVRPPDRAVVVSESAAACWPHGRGDRRQVRVEERGWMPVVATVRDAYEPNGVVKSPPQIYVVSADWSGDAALIVRMQPGHRSQELAEILRRSAPDMPFGATRTVADVVGEPARRLLGAVMFVAILAALAMLIAMFGVAAALYHAVAVRMREFGVRIAMGATPMDLMRTLVARDAPLVIVGEAGGILVTVAATRGYWSDLVTVSGKDPVVWGIVCGVLAASALIASAAPIARATRVDPIEVLRRE